MKINYKEACAHFMANWYSRHPALLLSAFYVCNTLMSCCIIDYEASTEVLHNQKYLIGKFIASERPIGYQICIRECMKRNCKSVNFNTENLQCDLMSTNDGSRQNGDVLQADPDFIFVNFSCLENNEKKMALQSAKLNETHDNYVCTTIRSKKDVCVMDESNPGFGTEVWSLDVRHRDCQDIYMYNTRLARNGVYKIFPSEEGDFIMVYCDMTNGYEGWTIFQRRMNGLTDFYRNWEDYKYGFGNPNDEFWLGNEYLHQLTKNRDCHLRIDLVNRDNIARYAQYEHFRIGDENDGYRLNVGKYTGNAGHDSLRAHNGMQFTTRDRDNDLSNDNCAVLWTGAWWYNTCHRSNLNGNYSIINASAKGVRWDRYPSSDYMKETTMKLKCG